MRGTSSYFERSEHDVDQGPGTRDQGPPHQSRDSGGTREGLGRPRIFPVPLPAATLPKIMAFAKKGKEEKLEVGSEHRTDRRSPDLKAQREAGQPGEGEARDIIFHASNLSENQTFQYIVAKALLVLLRPHTVQSRKRPSRPGKVKSVFIPKFLEEEENARFVSAQNKINIPTVSSGPLFF